MIDGVVLKLLTVHADDRGFLMKVVCFTDRKTGSSSRTTSPSSGR